MDTLILATDGSPSAHHATEKAIELAQATGWPLRVVSAWQTPTIVGSYYGYAIPEAYSPELLDVERERAADAAAAAVNRARALGIDATAEVRHGDPVEEICAAAGDAGAALIVLGAHGWGALKRLVFGSVSTGVLHHAPCGVLVVRGTPQAAETLLAGSVAERAT
ncbi:MAG TPA: universal stress protein [Gaiellaceae bacterium]|nr:universal stress protein [Gaiellaceae bacterium]